MTEKRFKLGYVCGDFGLIVNDEWIDLHSMSESSEKNVQICINKMNELAEENQDLKSFNKDLAENLSACANARISKDNHIEKLEKENKELKGKCEFMEKILENKGYTVEYDTKKDKWVLE